MAMIYTTARERAATATRTARAGGRTFELVALIAASVLSAAGVLLVYGARAPMLAEADSALSAGQVIDLNTVDQAEVLLPLLEPVVADPAERRFLADRVVAWLNTPDGSGSPRRHVEGVGALSAITVTDADLPAKGLPSIRERLAERRDQLVTNPSATEARVALLTPPQVAALRHSFVVRTPAAFRRNLWTAASLFLAGFYLAHAWARWRRSTADPILLPVIHALCGIGFTMMLSLRDPVRDPALFMRFAEGTLAGAAFLAVASTVDFQRSLLRRLSYVPLLGAVSLSLLLIAFGSGPGMSDAKVNLVGVQPVEAIRVLVVLFLAGYFANRWEALRSLKEPRAEGSRLGLDVPRFDYVLPVLIGMGFVLLFFFLQKDLGPALVLACVFLGLYGVARGRATMVAVGVLLLAAGFVAGYAVGYPHTVVQRILMWASPWDNPVRGGDQIAHALWALSTGAVSGTGLGLGDPRLVPAGHTDLVLAAIGEELGLLGLLAVFALYAVLAYRALRIALRAPSDYTCFLALGLVLGIFLQLLLIATGLLGLMPLTGVTTPFLSYGRSSMLANLFAVGVLLSISGQATGEPEHRAFARPVQWVGATLAAAALVIVGRTAYIQTVAADRTVAATSLSVQADGIRRFEYNPRLLAAAQQVVRGTITDRNGIPLATSRPADLQAQAKALSDLGISAADVCPQPTVRCYPFGGLTFHLLGDWHSQVNWAAANTSFVERDSDTRLRGYNDHARVVEVGDMRTGRSVRVIRRDLVELVPLLRNRYRPASEDVTHLLDRPRDVRLALDIRLQLKVAAALKAGVEHAGLKGGAAVVLSPEGDLLASVSYPWPSPLPARPAARAPSLDTTNEDAAPQLLDRARYGLYPPGSSFKLVTAAATLRTDPTMAHLPFVCERLKDGRVGRQIPGWSRPVRDDPSDRVPHGRLEMERALIVSCNAYFAQLGLHLGAPALRETAALFEVSLGQPDSPRLLRETLPFAAYGQGQVLATPFKMARVAATIAGDGLMPQGRWVIDETNRRTDPPRPILDAVQARALAQMMRRVVTDGTGRPLAGIVPAIAGKTGTAEVQDAAAHAWFVGFAPADAAAPAPPPGVATTGRIAFAVIVEHGGYGAAAAAPVAGAIVTAAKELGIIR